MNLTIKSKKANDATITSAGGAMGLVSLIVGLIILYMKMKRMLVRKKRKIF